MPRAGTTNTAMRVGSVLLAIAVVAEFVVVSFRDRGVAVAASAAVTGLVALRLELADVRTKRVWTTEIQVLTSLTAVGIVFVFTASTTSWSLPTCAAIAAVCWALALPALLRFRRGTDDRSPPRES